MIKALHRPGRALDLQRLALLVGVSALLSACAGTTGLHIDGTTISTRQEPRTAPETPKPTPIASTRIGGASLGPSDCYEEMNRSTPVFRNDLFNRYRGSLKVNDAITFLNSADGHDLQRSNLTIDAKGPLGTLLREEGMERHKIKDQLFEQLESPQAYLTMTADFADYCGQVYARDKSGYQATSYQMNRYEALQTAYQGYLDRRAGVTEAQAKERAAQVAKRIGPYLTLANGELEAVVGEPLTAREKLRSMAFLQETVWPTLYIPQNNSCSFVSTQADPSRFVFTDATSLVYSSVRPFKKAVITDDGQHILTLTPNADNGKTTKLSQADSARLVQLFQEAKAFRVNLSGTRGMNKSHRITLKGFEKGYRHYQDCLAKL